MVIMILYLTFNLLKNKYKILDRFGSLISSWSSHSGGLNGGAHANGSNIEDDEEIMGAKGNFKKL